MKRIHNLRFFLLLPLLATILGLQGCSTSNASADFWVRGNCEMCKATIEAALTANPGVAAADYQIETQTLHVDYDSTQINLAGLHAACASAGYETKTQAAQEEAYAELPKCCKKPEDQ
jgi:periplasmic mercuric ion binding protein